MRIARPDLSHLPSFVEAAERGWSMDLRGSAAASEQLEKLRADPQGFLDSLEDRLGAGAPIRLPDGSAVPRLPGFQRWLWDGEFCGSIGLRWQPGTMALPEYCLGHVGYGVVPWKRKRGYATSALAQLLPEARALGFPHVDLTTDPGNLASQKVIAANGGFLVGTFIKPVQFGSTPGLLFRISLA
jgi:predicted acetyltransferase